MDYTFLGVKSFLESLDEMGLEYHIFEEDDYSCLFNAGGDILKRGDSVISGIITREGQRAFFSQFGLKITKSYHAYILFIFDRHPTTDDLLRTLEGLEEIVMDNLDHIDLSDLAEKMKKREENERKDP